MFKGLPKWFPYAAIGCIVIAFVLQRVFKPAPIPADYQVQRAVNEQLIKNAYDRMYDRAMEHHRLNAELRKVRDENAALYKQLQLSKIQDKQHDRFKDLSRDSLLRFLVTVPERSWAAAVDTGR